MLLVSQGNDYHTHCLCQFFLLLAYSFDTVFASVLHVAKVKLGSALLLSVSVSRFLFDCLSFHLSKVPTLNLLPLYLSLSLYACVCVCT